MHTPLNACGMDGAFQSRKDDGANELMAGLAKKMRGLSRLVTVIGQRCRGAIRYSRSSCRQGSDMTSTHPGANITRQPKDVLSVVPVPSTTEEV